METVQKKSKPVLAALVVVLLMGIPLSGALAIEVGSEVSQVKVRDANGNPTWIAHLGTKVVVLLYTDPDEAGQNDPLCNYLKTKKYPKAKYQMTIVMNVKDAPYKPAPVIRMMSRRKAKQFRDAAILTDPAHLLKTAWGLGDCDDKAAVLVIGKDKKVYHYHKGCVPRSDFARIDRAIKELLGAR